jgi:hypothetical protein
MYGEVFQSLSPCSIDQRFHQETSQAIISMLACDIHALEKSRQPLPVLRPGIRSMMTSQAIPTAQPSTSTRKGTWVR